MFAHTDKGTMIYLPEGMKDVQAKDDFVTKVRLIAGSCAATAVVIVMESWVTMAKKGENLDMTPPSESHERQEMVVCIGESSGEHCSQLLPIVRLDNGQFWNLGDPQELGSNLFQGRFTQLLPPNPPDEAAREMGMMLLKAMGAKVELFKPSES